MPGTTVQRVYLLLLLLHTLAASLIWGINTLFLLDAGLSNAQAFAANAFFTAGSCCSRCRPASSPTCAGGALLPARHAHAGRLDAALSADVADVGAVLGLGDGVGAARARLHVLLGRRAGVARRCAESERIRRRARCGVRQGEIVEGVAMLGGSVLGGTSRSRRISACRT